MFSYSATIILKLIYYKIANFSSNKVNITSIFLVINQQNLKKFRVKIGISLEP